MTAWCVLLATVLVAPYVGVAVAYLSERRTSRPLPVLPIARLLDGPHRSKGRRR